MTTHDFDRAMFGERPGDRPHNGKCWGCSHKPHALYACPERPKFTFEDRCGCDRNYGD